MAKATESPKPRYVMVEKSPSIGAANRNAEGGTLQKSGRLVLNADGSDIWRDTVKGTGLPLDNHLSKFGVDAAGQTIAVFAKPHGTPNCAPVRSNSRPKGTDTFTLYLGAVFAEYHELRPAGNRSVKVMADTDADGTPIMVISLASALVVPTFQDPATKAQAQANKSKRRRRRKQDENGTNPGAQDQAADPQPEAKA